MNKGIWYLNNAPNFPSLNSNLKTDILIVGGGLTGLNILYNFRNSNLRVTLIEQNKLLSSTTMKSTAKLSYLQEDILSKIRNCYNEKKAKLYLESQKDAIDNILEIIKNENIDCDLKNCPGYLFINEKKNKCKLVKEINLYKKFGVKFIHAKRLPTVTKKYHDGYYVNDTYTFHPVKYGYGLINSINNKNINIYENTRMIKFQYNNGLYDVLINNNFVIKCKYLIIANNYPSFLFPYLFPLKTSLEKSYISLIENDSEDFHAINLDSKTDSFRTYKNKIIHINDSKKLSTKNVNNFKDYDYTNYDVITPDSLPIVDRISNNLFIGTGYNTWGMTNSKLAADIIYDLINKNDNKYYSLTCIRRKKSLNRYFNILINLFLNTVHFISSWFVRNNSATIRLIDGIKFGVYVDSNGIEHYVKITCPHMKCKLHFNSKEICWDCPCHGSRFDIDGNIIKGPSTTCVSKDTLS